MRKRFAGFVSLRLGECDKAINHSFQGENCTTSFPTAGKFYYALTLMKRDQPDDKMQAKNLLQQKNKK